MRRWIKSRSLCWRCFSPAPAIITISRGQKAPQLQCFSTFLWHEQRFLKAHCGRIWLLNQVKIAFDSSHNSSGIHPIQVKNFWSIRIIIFLAIHWKTHEREGKSLNGIFYARCTWKANRFSSFESGADTPPTYILRRREKELCMMNIRRNIIKKESSSYIKENWWKILKKNARSGRTQACLQKFRFRKYPISS